MRYPVIVAAAAALLAAVATGAAIAQVVIPAKPTTIEGLTATVVSLQQQINVQKMQIADLQAKAAKTAGAGHTHDFQRTTAAVATVACSVEGCRADGKSAMALTSVVIGGAK